MADDLEPRRIQFNFTSVQTDNTSDIFDAIVGEAEKRGFFFEWGGIFEMDREDVIPGSPLEEAVTGVPSRD